MYYLLWHDDSKKAPLADKVDRAMDAFVKRFGAAPTLILVNAAEKVEVPGVLVEVGASVLPGDFWIGPVEGVWL